MNHVSIFENLVEFQSIKKTGWWYRKTYIYFWKYVKTFNCYVRRKRTVMHQWWRMPVILATREAEIRG
jgi:hypothetical protein